MLLSRSFKRKVFATCGAALGFTLLYEAHVFDSRYAAQQAAERAATAKPAPGLRVRFEASAYCKGDTTASGAAVRTGIAAADPDLLPVGSVVQLDSSTLPKYNGIYTVMDTGPAVQGRRVDLYMWSCHEALAFGRRPVQLNVLRLGWNPRASTPRVVGSMFKQREADMKEQSAGSPLSPAPTDGSSPAVPPATGTIGDVPAAVVPDAAMAPPGHHGRGGRSQAAAAKATAALSSRSRLSV